MKYNVHLNNLKSCLDNNDQEGCSGVRNCFTELCIKTGQGETLTGEVGISYMNLREYSWQRHLPAYVSHV